VADQYLNTLEEIWKPIHDFPGYDISDHGRVRSYWKKQGRNRSSLDNTPQKVFNPGGKRYPHVTLTRDGQKFCFNIHRLVLLVFVGQAPPDNECRHLDGNSYRPELTNLKWGTRSENARDKVKHGTHPQNGTKNANSTLTDEIVLKVRNLASQGVLQIEIAKLFKISRAQTNRIIHRKRWPHI
jgi:hypothetical protein